MGDGGAALAAEEDAAATEIQRAVRGAMARAMVSDMEDEIDAIMRSMAAEADAEEIAVGSDDGSTMGSFNDGGVWAQRAARSPTPPLRKHVVDSAPIGCAPLRLRSGGESAVRWDAVTVLRAGSIPNAQGSGSGSRSGSDGSSGGGGDLFAYFPQMLAPEEQESQPAERDTAFDGPDGPLNRASEFGRLQNALDGGGGGKLGAIVFAPMMVAGDSNGVSGDTDDGSDSDDDVAGRAAMTSSSSSAAAAAEEEVCGGALDGGDLFAHFPQMLAPEEQEAQPAERDTAFDGPDSPLNRASEFGRLQNALDGGGAGKLGAIVFSSWASSEGVAGINAESSDAVGHGASAIEARPVSGPVAASEEEERVHIEVQSDWHASTGGEQTDLLALKFGFAAPGAAAGQSRPTTTESETGEFILSTSTITFGADPSHNLTRSP